MKKKQIKIRNQFAFYFSNLRLRTQVLILQIIYLVIITTCLICLTLIFSKNIIDTLAFDSQKVLTQKEMNRISENYLSEFIFQINFEFLKRSQSLNAINQLYIEAQDKKFQFLQNIDICNSYFNSSELMKQIKNSYCSCYGIAGDKNYEYHDKLRLSNILAFTATIQQNYSQLYYSSNTNDQFYTFRPCIYVAPAYIPKQRPWYIQHNQSNQQIQYSSAYVGYQGGVRITQTKSLLNEQNFSIGIIANDITMVQLSIQNQNQIAEILIIDFQGKILLSSHYEKWQKVVDYFYNESKTGFNESDFEILLQYQQNTSYNNLCQIPIDNTFCLFDKLKQKLFYFKLDIIMNNKYIVVAKFDPFLYSSAMNTLLEEINSKNQQMITLLIFIIIAALFIFFISFLITTFILQRPIEKLMYYSNQQNKLGKFLQTPFPKMKIGNSIDELNLAFFNLLNQQNRNKKNEQSKNKHLYSEICNYLKNLDRKYFYVDDKVFQNLRNLNYPILNQSQSTIFSKFEQILLFNFVRMINYKIYSSHKSDNMQNNN